jgi:hypothetical protein
METFALVYLALAVFSFFELKLLVENTVVQLRKDIQIVARFSESRGYEDPAFCTLEGLDPYLKAENSRAMKIAFICAIFLPLIIIPAALLDRSAFEDAFISRYKIGARNRILNNLP